MVKRTIFAVITLLLCLMGVVAANPALDAKTAIKTYAEMYALSESENRTATLMSNEMHGRMTARIIVNLQEILQDYPLSEETFTQIQNQYIEKLRQNINLQTKLKDETKTRAVVEVKATPINHLAIADLAAKDSAMQDLKTAVQKFRAAGISNTDIRNDKNFQNRAAEIIGNFIEKISFGQSKTFDVNCKLVKSGENLYWIPDDAKALNNSLVTDILPDFFYLDTSEGVEIEVVNDTDDIEIVDTPTVIDTQPNYGTNDKWLIYWYVCGSNLESQSGEASADIAEMEAVRLSPNVRIIIQTGGSKDWKDNRFSSNALGRWIYDSTGLHLFENASNSSMGNAFTLKDFIDFGENYNAKYFQADHKIFIFWDHGLSNVGGVCTDENYKGDYLTLNEINSAFQGTRFDIIGFDTCLGANYEYANNIENFARYMVASEATEPSCGWYYTGWLNDLSRNPTVNAKDLSIKICDSYMDGVKKYNAKAAKTATLSVFDLSKMPQLRTAYENYGKEALNKFNQNYNFSSILRNAAISAQHYISKGEYMNQVDLETLAQNTKQILPINSDNLIRAIRNARVHKNHGDDDFGGGLGAYFLYSGRVSQIYLNQNAAPQPQKDLFKAISNYYPDLKMTNSGEVYRTKNSQELTAEEIINMMNQYIKDAQALSKNIKTELNDDGLITAKISKNLLPYISEVRGLLMKGDILKFKDGTERLALLYLGTNNKLAVDWNTGKVEDKFDGKWVTLNGNLVSINPISNNRHGSNLYEIPVLLNDKFCALEVVYDGKNYSVISVNDGVDSEGVVSRKNPPPKKGDIITPLFLGFIVNPESSSLNLQYIPRNSFQIAGDLILREKMLDDSEHYGYCFQFVDMHGMIFPSNSVSFEIDDGDIYSMDIADNLPYDMQFELNDGNIYIPLPEEIIGEIPDTFDED